MAQTGYTPIQIYSSATAAAAPSASNLVQGELAINVTDGKLYYKDNGGSVQVIGWKTVPYTAGGTGLASTPTNGQIPIGTGSGYALSTITAGTGITVTNGSGTITIASTAGTGDVVGPASAVNNNIAVFDGVTGKLIKDGGLALPSSAIVGINDSQTLTNKTFGNSTLFLSTSTTVNDGINITGRSGGSSSYRVVVQPAILTNSRLIEFPDANGTVVLTIAAQTLTNKALGSGTVLTADVVGTDFAQTRTMFKDTGWKYYDSGSSNALDYVNGSHQRWAPSTGAQTLSIANWAPTGNLSELLIEGINLGASTITWPTINWIQPSGATTTTIATYLSSISRSLQTSGTDFVLLWTRDAGTTIYGKLL